MKNTIYIRTSTEEQNPENQLRDCQEIALKLNLECDIISDKQSAWNDGKEREGFESIRKAIINKQIKNLICWDLDRLFRNRKKLIAFFELCKMNGCKIYSWRQAWLEDLNKMPSPFDEIVTGLMLQVMGWLSEEESNKKSHRVKLAIRKEDGITRSYKGNKWGRKNISETTKQAIIGAFKQGKSYSQICESVFYWDKNGNKKFVSKGIVHKIIKNYEQEKSLITNIHKIVN